MDDVAQWLTAARAGSLKALGQALEACRGYLLLIAKDELDPELQAKGGASDLVQQTFLEACKDFTQFRGGSEKELLAWLRKLLLNNLSNFARRYRETDKRGISREVPLDAGGSSAGRKGEPPGDTPSPSDAVKKQEQEQALQRALHRLPDNHRRIILLRLEDHSFEEIAQMMGCSPGTARKRWSLAIRRLRQEMGEAP